jgi:Inner membrane protein CreD
MTVPRLLAVGFIFVCTVVAWSILGGSVVHRTGESDSKLAEEVAQLWGGQHNQVAPEGSCPVPHKVLQEVQQPGPSGAMTLIKVWRDEELSVPMTLESSRVTVSLKLDQRQKGLLWYNTYAVEFRGHYRFRDEVGGRKGHVSFIFPSNQALYDGFTFKVNGQEGRVTEVSSGLTVPVDVPKDGLVEADVAYKSRGLGEWTYALSRGGVAQVRDFTLDLETDFREIDFPAGTLSPTSKTATPSGWKLAWRFESLVSGQKLGVEPPSRLNPGPLAARITFFAPVGLLFFFTVMVILGMVNARSLHPMNYFFLAAAFFAFHLLLAYLVDHVSLHASFAIAAATSVFLVISYLRLVAGLKVAVLQAGVAQLIFLVLFSYAFFFEGYAGLTVAVGAVLTLFVLMQLTARVDWSGVFGKKA